MDEDMQGRELSVDEIQRILDLPSYAIEDIRTRHQRQEPMVHGFRGGGRLMSLEEPEQHQYGGGEHPDALLAATSIPYSQEYTDSNGGYVLSPESGISSGHEQGSLTNHSSPASHVSIVLGSPHTGSILMGGQNSVGLGGGGSPGNNMSGHYGNPIIYGSPTHTDDQGLMFPVSPGSVLLSHSPTSASQSVLLSHSPTSTSQSVLLSHSPTSASQSVVMSDSPPSSSQGDQTNNIYTIIVPQQPGRDAFKFDAERFMAADTDSFIAADSVKSQPSDVWTFNTQEQVASKNEYLNINIPQNIGTENGKTYNTSEVFQAKWQPKQEKPLFSLPGSISFSQESVDSVYIPRRASSTDSNGSTTGVSSGSMTGVSPGSMTGVSPGSMAGVSPRAVSSTSGVSPRAAIVSDNQVSSPSSSYTFVNDKGETEYFCAVCGDKYYELFACKKEEHCEVNVKTRKNCQFCRFKKCLNNGMKVSWVLSDEERNRRFNKFNKTGTSKQEAQSMAVQRFNSNKTSMIAQPTMTFTMEEFKVLDDILRKYEICKDTFVHNIITMSKRAVKSLIENAYDLGVMEYQEFQCLMKTMNLILTNTVLPQFSEMGSLTYVDRNVLMQNQTMRIFKAQLMIDTEEETGIKIECKQEPDPELEVEGTEPEITDSGFIKCLEKAPSCPMKKHVRTMSMDKSLMNSLGLDEKLAKLNIREACPKLPKYRHLYRPNWSGGDLKAEERHRELTVKITCWPVVNNKMDPKLIALMTTILIFNVDTSELADRSILPPKAANEKFLEAMFLLSYTRELRDLEQLHVNRKQIVC